MTIFLALIASLVAGFVGSYIWDYIQYKEYDEDLNDEGDDE